MENNNVQDLHHEEGEGNHPNPSFIPFSSLDELPMDEGETTELVWRNGQVMVQCYSNVRNQAANAAAGEIPAAVAEEVEVSPEHPLAEEEMAWFQHQNEGSFLDRGFYDGDVVDPAPPAATNEAVETTVVAPLSVEEVNPEEDAQSGSAAAGGGSPMSGGESAAPRRETSRSSSPDGSTSSFSANAEQTPLNQTSNTPPPPPEEDGKRKAKENEEEESHSEDNLFKVAEGKSQASGSTSSKRTRTPEKHNLSARMVSSMGYGMHPGMQPHTGASPSMVPYPSTEAYMGPRFPVPAFRPPEGPSYVLSRTEASNQNDHSVATNNPNQPRAQNFPDPYQQFVDAHQSQSPLTQAHHEEVENEEVEQPNSPSTNSDSEESGNPENNQSNAE